MHVYVYIDIHIYMHIQVYIYIYIYVYVYICACLGHKVGFISILGAQRNKEQHRDCSRPS